MKKILIWAMVLLINFSTIQCQPTENAQVTQNARSEQDKILSTVVASTFLIVWAVAMVNQSNASNLGKGNQF